MSCSYGATKEPSLKKDGYDVAPLLSEVQIVLS